MKTHSKNLALALLALALAASARAQVNSGSTGADGAFNPTVSTNINMADHPDGIYHYTSVNIPAGVTVTFTPNANNTPVVWLVQGNCWIGGEVSLSAPGFPYGSSSAVGKAGGPGGYRGGNGRVTASAGLGLGGGNIGTPGGNGTFGTTGQRWANDSAAQGLPGQSYGNNFLVPLVGGSGGGGCPYDNPQSGGGGGGGGAILIAASGIIELNGRLTANGANGEGSAFGTAPNSYASGGAGSGGAVRLVTTLLRGSGHIDVSGGKVIYYWNYGSTGELNSAGQGRVRLDTIENNFGGTVVGPMTQGFQPIILPVAGQGTQLAIASVAGAPVAASPNGLLATPDSIIAAQASNPVVIVVRCTNLPLNTPVTVTVKPANGAAISAVGYNNTGTLASSTATVSLNMPRGGGLIYATAATAP